MFVSRKKLKARIRELEDELSTKRHVEKVSAYVTDANLPKCESLACVRCEYFACYRNNAGGIYSLGCGKHIGCKDFTPFRLTPEEEESARRELLRQ